MCLAVVVSPQGRCLPCGWGQLRENWAYKQIGVDELANAPGEPQVPNFSEAALDFGNAIEKVLLDNARASSALASAQSQALSQLQS